MIVRELLARFGIDFDSDKVAKGEKSLEALTVGVKSLGKLLLGSAIAVGVGRFVDGISQLGADLAHTSRSLNMGAQDLYEWQGAAKLAGVSGEEFTGALQAVSGQMKGVLTGSEDAIRIFGRLGVSVFKAKGGGLKDLSEVFEDVAGKLGNVRNESEKYLIATTLFGPAGAKLLPFFDRGAEGIAAMRAEVRELTGQDVEAFTKTSVRMRESLTRWELASNGVKMALANGLLPILTWFVSKVSAAKVWVDKMTEGTHVLELGLAAVAIATLIMAKGMIAAGIATLVAWAPVIGTAALIAAAIAVVVLIVDDLIALFTGGESAIGDFLDELFGAGTAAAVVSAVKDAFATLVEWVTIAWEKVKEWGAAYLEIIGKVAAFIGEAFGPAWEKYKAFVGGMWDLWKEVFTAIWEFGKKAVGGVVDFFSGLFDRIRGVASAIAKFFGIELPSLDDLKDAAKGGIQLAANVAASGLGAAASVASGAAAGVKAFNQANQVEINVNGAGDPDAVAARVADEFRRQTEADLEAGYADLVPVGG